MNLELIVSQITDALAQKNVLENYSEPDGASGKSKQIVIKENTQHLPKKEQQRIHDEFLNAGPIECLLNDDTITEIVINSPKSIWYEKYGTFHQHRDVFLSEVTYSNFIHLLEEQAGTQTNHRFPFANGNWRGFRIHIVAPPIVKQFTLTLRRLKSSTLTLEELFRKNWCAEESLKQLEKCVLEKENILVIGTTGSGKTTLLNSLIQKTTTDRCVFIEDTAELIKNNELSVRLLTREDANGVLPTVDQTDLVKQSLRMRPDRLIVGEIRGSEAKDLLLALSTGHRGSMASIHAANAAEALMRLEMLVLMGAPQWDLLTIRRLIQLTIHTMVVTSKHNDHWKLEGIFKISSLENFGFTIEEK
jgi:pilus assembly protein CpaF